MVLPLFQNCFIATTEGLIAQAARLCNRRKGSSERFGGDQHFLNVIAVRALKGAEVESDSCGHDASEHHASTAPWAGGALDLNADIVR
jgi:hypothetical protein